LLGQLGGRPAAARRGRPAARPAAARRCRAPTGRFRLPSCGPSAPAARPAHRPRHGAAVAAGHRPRITSSSVPGLRGAGPGPGTGPPASPWCSS
jgi:hypothetical protein